MARDRAIVIGASMAGLAAAAAAARHFREVVLVDKDVLDASRGRRQGVPQSAHTHLLLDRGREAWEGLLPGLCAELARAGSTVIDFGLGLRFFHHAGWKVATDTRFQAYFQTRPFLEDHVRQRISALPRVALRERTRAVSLLSRGGAVTGVSLEGPEGTQALEADLVLDASGRGSRAPAWLEALGVGAVPEDRVAIDLAYGSLLFEPTPGLAVAAHRGVAIYGRRPEHRRHAVVLAVEGGRWLLTAAGYGGDRPPADVAGLLAYVRELARPDIAELLGQARAVGEVETYRFKEQYRRRFSQLPLPAGFGVVGDAACSLDPIFGQGMTVSAMTAEALDRHLARGPFEARRYAREVEAASRTAWLVTSVEAFRYATTRGHRPRGVGLLQRFLDRVYERSTTDAEVYRAYIEVMMLQRGPEHMLRPDLLWRLVRPSGTGPRAEEGAVEVGISSR